MLKRIKKGLFSSETQKKLSAAGIDKTHEFVHPKDVYNLSNLLLNPKTKNQLLNFLYKAINSCNNTLAIKSLIVIHACLRRNFDEDLCSLINDNNNLMQGENKKKTDDVQQDIDMYINQKVRNFYFLYLKKICMYRQSYLYIKKYMNKQLTVQYRSSQDIQHDQLMQIVCHGFKILNMSHFVFQSQQMFNKMGRYHIEFQQIMSIYVQLLEDFNLYNSYINKSVNVLFIKEMKTQPTPKRKEKKQITQNDIKLKQRKNSNSRKISEQQQTQKDHCVQQTKHFYLYMSECQKVSDRLYQFYHNRYYYKLIKPLVKFPSFLVIKNQQYRQITNKARKIDKNLVHSVKMSKYDSTLSKNGILRTQQNEQRPRRRNTSLSYHTSFACNNSIDEVKDKFYNTQIITQSKTEYTIQDEDFN